MNPTAAAVELAKRGGHWRARWMGTTVYWLSAATDTGEALAEMENELRNTYREEPSGAEVDWGKVVAVLLDDAAR